MVVEDGMGYMGHFSVTGMGGICDAVIMTGISLRSCNLHIPGRRGMPAVGLGWEQAAEFCTTRTVALDLAGSF